ncbi:molybdopterin-guanine dinucleotide biosynthesis protein B [Anoxybacillus tepidamans]|uniref:Molybdopterin-guanine dinucleotide biosynthesis protein B n=1 Tax=Anoxybacteroides tepidamans TaxID=265948 RepID=A0A7W8IRW0_9BACL|nr:molybdopterin-guanine dinucleotide biosynthesis protein B [Anoxybacillus tepidamans]MBB5325583.1 molybdopterin-guanine dinucleotide biosynthesis protein B [Anoxybacillus tepidamans]
MNVWQVVGYKNSGKTTLVEKWVRKAAAEGYKVGTIKHHGHGGYPDIACAANDSSRHQAAGALVASVEGSGLLQLYAFQREWTLPQILHIYSFLPLDFVIVEGYKYERYRKIVMIRNASDWQQLCNLKNIAAVISWEPVSSLPYPVFAIDDEEKYLQWLMNEVKKTV